MSTGPAEWFYIKDGNRLGPVPAAQLKQMASTGQLTPEDLIWKNGMQNWMAASGVKGLFAPRVAAGPAQGGGPQGGQPGPPPMRPQYDDQYDWQPARPPVRRTSGRFTFDGGAGGFFLRYLAFYFLALITLGIWTPWGVCMILRWKRHHTIIDGKRLRFEGTGGELFLRFLLWYLLMLITLGIYTIWVVPKFIRWTTENTDFDDGRADD